MFLLLLSYVDEFYNFASFVLFELSWDQKRDLMAYSIIWFYIAWLLLNAYPPKCKNCIPSKNSKNGPFCIVCMRPIEPKADTSVEDIKKD